MAETRNTSSTIKFPVAPTLEEANKLVAGRVKRSFFGFVVFAILAAGLWVTLFVGVIAAPASDFVAYIKAIAAGAAIFSAIGCLYYLNKTIRENLQTAKYLSLYKNWANTAFTSWVKEKYNLSFTATETYLLSLGEKIEKDGTVYAIRDKELLAAKSLDFFSYPPNVSK